MRMDCPWEGRRGGTKDWQRCRQAEGEAEQVQNRFFRVNSARLPVAIAFLTPSGRRSICKCAITLSSSVGSRANGKIDGRRGQINVTSDSWQWLCSVTCPRGVRADAPDSDLRIHRPDIL